MQTSTTTSSSTDAPFHDDYQPMLDAVAARFTHTIAPDKIWNTTLFTTDVDGRALWDLWLVSLPLEARQEHTCHECRRFVERFGGLVRIEEDGKTTPAIFGDAPGIYAAAFEEVVKRVKKARVTGVFVSSESTYGMPQNRDRKQGRTWRHMHVVPPATMRYPTNKILDSGQRRAELGEDYATLSRALGEFKADVVNQALAIAQGESLYRGEKIEGRLKWLSDLIAKRDDVKGPARENLVWLAVATAPAGFAHVRSSVVGSLLEDLAAGKSFAEVKRSFDAKMSPLKYQRPTAPPTVGNIKQAEETIAKLGLERSLKRRYARLDDVKPLWTPAPPKDVKPGGVFKHLLPGADKNAPLATTGPTLTWEKFARTVLPGAEQMHVYAPTNGNYTALVTASDPDAPPILQWDRESARNPVSWYTYAYGSGAAQWNLRGGTFVPVTAVTLMPNMWQEGFEHQGKGALFLLQGCRDTRGCDLSLFPELLKSELHSVRSTIEAFSRRGRIEGENEASAAGLTVRAGENKGYQLRVRVLSRGILTDYTVDRWD